MVSSGMKKEKPVKKRKIDISGKVVRSRFRRPKVSIVYTAGIANSQFIKPKPREAAKAEMGEKCASRNICEE